MVKVVLLCGGSLCVGLGVIGIFLPLLPTTPFLLLAAALYARGSKKFYHWLLENRLFGSYVKNYRQKRGLPLKIKIGVVYLLWVTISISAVFAIGIFWVRVMLLVIALGVTIHVWLLKTLKN